MSQYNNAGRILFKKIILTSTFIGMFLGVGYAQYNPENNYVESSEVALHYPEPNEIINTPAFQKNTDTFTSYKELTSFIQQLSEKSEQFKIRNIGISQEKRSIPLLILTEEGMSNPQLVAKNGKPTILVIAQQHGNEPASGEATLALANSIIEGREGSILSNINLLIIPRANPDGAEKFIRETANGINLNRDHLLLVTPEAQAIAKVLREYHPDVIIDNHEQSVASVWLEKFDRLLYSDISIQYSTTANQLPDLQFFSEIPFRKNLIADLEKNNLSYDWYFTSNAKKPTDNIIAMGGINADISRNVAGLRNAVSFLIETRGIGIGKAHFKRRVFSHLTALHSLIRTTVDNSALVLDKRQRLNQQIINSAGQGTIVITGKATEETREVKFRDKSTGEIAPIEVTWLNSLKINPVLVRSRPYAYILEGTEEKAATTLRQLGIEIYKIQKPIDLMVDQYVVTSSNKIEKSDVTGSIGKTNTQYTMVKTEIEPIFKEVDDSYFYIPLNQPLANLAIAALEPESQNSYLSNNILSFPDESEVVKVLPVYRLLTKNPFVLKLWEK